MGIAAGVWCLGLLALVAGSPLQRDYSPEYSAEIVRKINAMNTTWKAGPNFAGQTAKSVLGRLRTKDQPRVEMPKGVPIQKSTIGIDELPEEFDSRNKWPMCTSTIGHVFDEGRCRAGWAISAIGAMRDRYCIKAKGEQFNYSVEDALYCLNIGIAPSNSCDAGRNSTRFVWQSWIFHGFVSGGAWNSTSGCKPYPYFPCDHYVNGAYGPCQNPPTEKNCMESCRPGYQIHYKYDKRKGSSYSNVDNNVEAIQKEIYSSGSVSAEIDLYEDFLTYESGIYERGPGKYLRPHGVKIIGWGVELKTPYWLCVNSWNHKWGDGGFVKIKRGSNEVGIEALVYTGQI